MMQPATSDKTFHLKWNNHLQNLSQLFTAIYSSSALADVTLSCRDGAIRAHKLVLSACSPYFEQIFRDNPCKHPVIILKGIPYAEINLLVEFMYKGSVDVQEIDLQSLMHTASELEIRGLAYELRKDASSLLNVNLNEYPTYASSQNQDASFTSNTESGSQNANVETATSTPSTLQTNLERLHQIHLYQQSMCRNTPYSQVQNSSSLASEVKRKRKNDDTMAPNTTTAVKNILAAAAKELAEKKETNAKPKLSVNIQTEDDANESNMETYESDSGETETTPENEELPHGRDTRFKGKKRVSVGMTDEYSPTPRILAKNKQGRKTIKFSIKTPTPSEGTAGYDSEDGISKVIISAVSGGVTSQITPPGILKCVNLNDLRENRNRDNNVTIIDDDDSSAIDTSDENNLLVETVYETVPGHEEDYDSNDSKGGLKNEERVFKCDICALSFVRKFHMKRHRRTHTGERPFQCDDCPFSFNRSSHLARHRRTHTGERPYHCEACGRTFTRGDKLKLHLRICEKDEYVLPSRVNAIEDPTKQQIKKEISQTVLPGMVSIGHSERHQLMFTSSGDVLLAPRSQTDSANDLNSSALSEINESNQSGYSMSDMSNSKLNLSLLSNQPSTSESLLTNQFYSLDAAGFPIKRGRGRPRKKPLPMVVPLIKKKRGRPPKIIKIDPMDPGSANRPLENYNVSNLPYGDFSYLTDIISTHFNPANPQSYQNMMQLNPLLDNAKLANLIANAVSQNQNAAAVVAAAAAAANPTTPSVDSTKAQLVTKDDKKSTTNAISLNNKDVSISPTPKESIQPPAPVENAATDASESPPPIAEESNSENKVESDCAITDLTSDKEESAEEDVEAVQPVDEDKSDDVVDLKEKTGLDIIKMDTFDLKSDGQIITTIGECTIKPVIKE